MKSVPPIEISIRNLESYPNMFLCVEATQNHLCYVRMWKDEIQRIRTKQHRLYSNQYQWKERLQRLDDEMSMWLECLQLLVDL